MKSKITFATYLAYFLSFMFLLSCNEQNDCCTIIDVNVQIHYQNESGLNLLNSTEEFNENSIKIYYKTGEDFDYVYNANLDHPNMYEVQEDQDGRLILTVFPSNNYESNMSTTLIELNESVVDTLVCEFDLDDNREVCTYAWLNGIKMNDRYISVKR